MDPRGSQRPPVHPDVAWWALTAHAGPIGHWWFLKGTEDPAESIATVAVPAAETVPAVRGGPVGTLGAYRGPVVLSRWCAADFEC